MKKIKLTQGKYTIVDDEDYPYLNRFFWHISSVGRVVRFVQHNNNKVVIPIESLLVVNKAPLDFIHLNGNKLDNRKENIKTVNTSYVCHRGNKRKNCTSKYKGVYWNSFDKRWVAAVHKDGKRHYAGHSWTSEDAAAKAYNKKAVELYGELAYQNEVGL